MDMTYEQIEAEFRRQVGLCSGLGRRRMLDIVKAHEFPFANGESDEGRAKMRELNPKFDKIGRNVRARVVAARSTSGVVWGPTSGGRVDGKV